MDIRRLSLIALLLVFFGCGKSIEKQARDQVRTMTNAHLAEERVSVSNVNQMGDTATADIEIQTAVRMRNIEGEWIVKEIRLGSQTWEDIRRFSEAIEWIRSKDTLSQMETVVEAAQKMIQKEGNLGDSLSYVELIDMLSPRYLEKPIREDAWGNPFSLLVTSEGFQIRSTGPDGRPGNSDDLVINNEK
mgnify:CR=1 FL=1